MDYHFEAFSGRGMYNLKSASRKGVGVRIPSWAPSLYRMIQAGIGISVLL